MRPQYDEGRKTLPGLRPSKIVSQVASDFALDSVSVRDLQRWTDRLMQSIADHKARQARRREGWQAINGAAVFGERV